MLLERTISQLDIGPLPPDQARQLGQLGYMQWIAGLPGGISYRHAALRAHERALPFAACSPAIAEFCALLRQSLEQAPMPLSLAVPPGKRRGGARSRRAWRMPL